MKVSVCLITYNQERFIEQAIASVLMQETKFEYELVIGEDCSKDRTQEIIVSYARRYPSKVRPLFAGKNMGAARNFVRTYSACKGEYVATLDGDDYWTSPYKLQKQVDYLDSHPECSGCFHAVKEIWAENGSHRLLFPPGRKPLYTLEDYAGGYIAYVCSTMFRNKLIKLPDWYCSSPIGDWPFQVLHAEQGPIGFLDEIMGVYRIQAGGIWYGRRTNYAKGLQSAIQAFQLLISYVKPQYKPLFRRHLYKRYYFLAHCLAAWGRGDKAREYASKCIREWGYDPRVSVVEPLKIYAHIYAGPIYNLLRRTKNSLVASRKRAEQGEVVGDRCKGIESVAPGDLVSSE